MRRTALLRAGPVLAAAVLAAALAGPAARAGEDDPEKPQARENYGETPDELVPFRGVGEPARRFFVEPPQFRGPGRDDPEPADVKEARIGVIYPFEGTDRHLGEHMKRGVHLAIEEANRAGGLRAGVPFAVVESDENKAWAAAGDALVSMTLDEGVWGVVGALEDSASHVMTRVVLKVEVPIVNAAGPDPTLTEHNIPWVLRVRPDDRQTGYALAKRIFEKDGRLRVGVIRGNDRYSRAGVKEFVDAARRLGHPVAVEVRYVESESEWGTQIEHLRSAKPDAVVLWGHAEVSGRVLRALRAAGVDPPVYGPDRLADPLFVRAAGAAAEGVVVTYPFDPGTDRPAWKAFQAAYRERHGVDPDAFAAYGYDATRMLLDGMRRAGLNRARIRDALFEPTRWEGVTGTVRFDATRNNVSPAVVGRIVNGAFVREN